MMELVDDANKEPAHYVTRLACALKQACQASFRRVLDTQLAHVEPSYSNSTIIVHPNLNIPHPCHDSSFGPHTPWLLLVSRSSLPLSAAHLLTCTFRTSSRFWLPDSGRWRAALPIPDHPDWRRQQISSRQILLPRGLYRRHSQRTQPIAMDLLRHLRLRPRLWQQCQLRRTCPGLAF
jgi:hypothetical protein